MITYNANVPQLSKVNNLENRFISAYLIPHFIRFPCSSFIMGYEGSYSPMSICLYSDQLCIPLFIYTFIVRYLKLQSTSMNQIALLTPLYKSTKNNIPFSSNWSSYKTVCIMIRLLIFPCNGEILRCCNSKVCVFLIPTLISLLFGISVVVTWANVVIL